MVELINQFRVGFHNTKSADFRFH